MIPKSGYRFSEKIMLKQQVKEKCRFNLKSFAPEHQQVEIKRFARRSRSSGVRLFFANAASVAAA
jgi:hypothetical protein